MYNSFFFTTIIVKFIEVLLFASMRFRAITLNVIKGKNKKNGTKVFGRLHKEYMIWCLGSI